VNTFISTLYMVLLALVVVVQWQNVDEINTDVRTEAYTLSRAHADVRADAGAEAAIVRASAVDYAQGVLHAEWPPPASTGADVVTKALDTGQAAVTHPVARTCSSARSRTRPSASSSRSSRRAPTASASATRTSRAVLIIALGVLSLITVLTPLALGLRSDALAFSGLVISTVLVCLSFWIVLDLQTLYSGLIHVDSTPLSRFLAGQVAG
jgi:hypothetical protein